MQNKTLAELWEIHDEVCDAIRTHTAKTEAKQLVDQLMKDTKAPTQHSVVPAAAAPPAPTVTVAVPGIENRALPAVGVKPKGVVKNVSGGVPIPTTTTTQSKAAATAGAVAPVIRDLVIEVTGLSPKTHVLDHREEIIDVLGPDCKTTSIYVDRETWTATLVFEYDENSEKKAAYAQKKAQTALGLLKKAYGNARLI